jgi:hypothetical protein
MAQAYIGLGAGILLGMPGDFKSKILVRRNIRIALPGPDVVTRNAGTADINIVSRVLYFLDVGVITAIAFLTICINDPGSNFRCKVLGMKTQAHAARYEGRTKKWFQIFHCVVFVNTLTHTVEKPFTCVSISCPLIITADSLSSASIPNKHSCTLRKGLFYMNLRKISGLQNMQKKHKAASFHGAALCFSLSYILESYAMATAAGIMSLLLNFLSRR